MTLTLSVVKNVLSWSDGVVKVLEIRLFIKMLLGQKSVYLMLSDDADQIQGGPISLSTNVTRKNAVRTDVRPVFLS